jgi:hypothetical protein
MVLVVLEVALGKPTSRLLVVTLEPCAPPSAKFQNPVLCRRAGAIVALKDRSEVVTHIAFYAGWPNAFSALPVVKEVFEKR